MAEDGDPADDESVDGDSAADGDANGDASGLSEAVVEAAETLTLRARRAVDEAEAAAYRDRRDDMLAEHGYAARVREEDGREVLVCHPEAWLADGTVQPDRIDDLDRAAEVPLSGPGDPDEWDDVAERNRSVATAVRDAHGDVHGDNAATFATFMSNHYAKPIADATEAEVAEFLEDYFVRNAWPSDEQAAVVEESVELALSVARER